MPKEQTLEKTLKKFLGKRKLREFEPHCVVNTTGNLLEVYLEDVPCYHEWIMGQGADISLIRALDNDRLVGAILPLKTNKKLKVYVV